MPKFYFDFRLDLGGEVDERENAIREQTSCMTSGD